MTLHTEDGEVCSSICFDGTGTPNRGHIHLGMASVNGGIEVPLFELVDLPADARNDVLEEGRLEDCVPASDEDISGSPRPRRLLREPAQRPLPAGAARGQLED